jgi:hypothetical protein
MIHTQLKQIEQSAEEQSCRVLLVNPVAELPTISNTCDHLNP